ncbi:ribonuclease III [Cutaneotrichosporon oleaginosum]|uniref:Ribonuclease III n=1 Tax=Cutaneotrichosporon oleaginosum TaxID=879819 RepID=A0A0J0XTT8_9TREE|nr:ribonuclease III [Cutaneotrichosporon oleaginosum]KLT44472.1 ribonuclease III [Cutaneotrichosporon oleaginosum]TXT14009.1 hypothetical protein COLE_00202 [Cutaneotrichosporon oleaginosum]
MASLAAIALPALPQFDVPSLPPIADKALRLSATTHSSYHQTPRNAQSLDLDYQLPEDYEKLEHIGDSVLGTLVTLLLQDLYPNLPAGSTTMLKAHLVKNETLAQISVRQDLMSQLRAAPSAVYTVRGQIKAQASVFEAHIAAVFFDFLRSPTPGGYMDDKRALPSTQLPPLPDMRLRTNGQALDYVGHFFRPIFTPIAEFAYAFMATKAEELRNTQHDGGVDEPDFDGLTSGAAASLNTFCMRTVGRIPEYNYIPLDVNAWECECVVVLKGARYVTTAVRSSKKAAMGVAAWKIGKLLNLDWAERGARKRVREAVADP